MKRTGISLGCAVLLTLFFLVSCIDTDYTLGSRMVPDNQDISLHTATLDLPVDLRMADSLQTTVTSSVTLGAIRTNRFGLFHSDAAFSVTPANDSITWGRNPAVRSITLSMTADTALIVNASQRYIPQNFYVHQLNLELDSTMTYNNSLPADCYRPELLAEGGCIYMGEGLYEVTITKAIGERLFQIPMSVLDSADLFMKQFYGFYLRCDDPEEGTEGGRLTCFDLSSSFLYLTYDYDDDEGIRRTKTVTFNLGEYYCLNRSSAGSRDLEEADTRQTLYMEGLCGIKPHIDARKVRSLVAAWAAENQIPLNNLLIAKATVSFPFEYNGDRTQFDYYSTTMFPSRRVRGETQVIYTPLDEINNTSMEDGTIDRSLLQYTSNISIYLQDLIQRDVSSINADDDLWMMPIVSYYNSYTSTTYYYSDYYYYTQNVLNGTAADRHPVLKLTYSILK